MGDRDPDPRLPITLDPGARGLLTEGVSGQTFECDDCGAEIVMGEDEVHREARHIDEGIERTVRCGKCYEKHMAAIERELEQDEAGEGS